MNSIMVTCPQCRNKVIVYLSNEEETDNINCDSCGLEIITFVKGVIYILSNDSMPGLVKIGFTEREPGERVKELNASTGVPEPFKVNAFFHSSAPYQDEQLIHSRLSDYRKNTSREFFQLTASQAVKIIRETLGRPPCFISNSITAKIRQQEYDNKPQIDHIGTGSYDTKCNSCGLFYRSSSPTVCPSCRSSDIKIKPIL